MIEGGLDWAHDNPEKIGSAVASGFALVAAAWMSKTSKKERRNGEERERRYRETSGILNGNAIEALDEAKRISAEGKSGVVGAVDKLLTGFRAIADEIITELRANRAETRANGILLSELLVDAKLPSKRKAEILDKYNNERGEEATADDEEDAE